MPDQSPNERRTHVRSCHPDAFRSGQWAELIATVPARGHDCWLVKFEDGETDVWPLEDPTAEYEFLPEDCPEFFTGNQIPSPYGY